MVQLLYTEVSNVFHECIGMLLLPPVLYHLYCVRRWWISPARGRYTAYRVLAMIMNVALLILFITVLMTGILISNELFAAWVPLEWRKMLVLHEVHRVLPWYMILMVSVHVGFHVPLRRTSQRTRSLLLLIAMGGMLLGTTEHMLIERLSFAHVFGTPAQMAGMGAGILSLIGIVFFGIFVGGIVRLRMCKRTER